MVGKPKQGTCGIQRTYRLHATGAASNVLTNTISGNPHAVYPGSRRGLLLQRIQRLFAVTQEILPRGFGRRAC